ncbi:hypothetical protein NONO_c60640 [Nocardia nova SH22a]|uniref:Uncharacterized protein n=1 Tax=Nocardia nova SH22a TaxID=1415166 RepID=W5TNB8_9NOCA|nr:hypothetical protein [Nocardia nova]AHH20840.1 hypothetical protein NONO_c60640 [Nocardia nova SH22a]
MVAGQEASPGDARSTERLMKYWAEGAGAVKIQWGTPGDWYRCVAELGKYVPDSQVKGLCENLHERATGMTTAEHTKLINAKAHKHGSHGDA